MLEIKLFILEVKLSVFDGLLDFKHGLLDFEHGLLDIRHGLLDFKHGLLNFNHIYMDNLTFEINNPSRILLLSRQAVFFIDPQFTKKEKNRFICNFDFSEKKK